jgi:hypothetical protein
MLKKPPNPVPRPKLASYIWARGMELKAVGDAIDCSHEHVRRMCLPFGDPNRRVPAEDLMARIVAWTDGEIRPADFYPADLNGEDELNAEPVLEARQ